MLKRPKLLTFTFCMFLPLLKCSSEQQQLIELILIMTVAVYIETLYSKSFYIKFSKMLCFSEMTMVISVDQLTTNQPLMTGYNLY